MKVNEQKSNGVANWGIVIIKKTSELISPSALFLLLFIFGLAGLGLPT